MEFNPKALIIAREKAGLTQLQLAKKMRCTAQWISLVETGFHKPNVRTLERLWEALGVTDPTPFFELSLACEQAESAGQPSS